MLPSLVLLLLASVVMIELARGLAALRRATRLNRAMHELRRPLQSISLSIEGSSPDLRCAGACLEQALVALADLDAAINRRRIRPRVVRTTLADVAGSLEDRWRFARVEVAPVAPQPIEADPARLGAALDNLVSNAIEHGSGPVRVRALDVPGSIRFEVLDSGPSDVPRPGAISRERHGHGLRAAAEHVTSQGGVLAAPRGLAGGGTVAALTLPASDGATGTRQAAPG